MQLLKPIEKFSKDERTAYHEAAHTVTSFYLGLRLECVSIVPDEHSLGRVEGRMPRRVQQDFDTGRVTDRSRLWIERQIMVLLSGWVTDDILGCSPEFETSDEHAAWCRLASRVTIGHEEREAFLHWLRIRTRRFVEEPLHWAVTEYLAKVLVAKRCLTGRQARKVVKDAEQDPEVQFRIDDLAIAQAQQLAT
jgi:hypothetical protein